MCFILFALQGDGRMRGYSRGQHVHTCPASWCTTAGPLHRVLITCKAAAQRLCEAASVQGHLPPGPGPSSSLYDHRSPNRLHRLSSRQPESGLVRERTPRGPLHEPSIASAQPSDPEAPPACQDPVWESSRKRTGRSSDQAPHSVYERTTLYLASVPPFHFLFGLLLPKNGASYDSKGQRLFSRSSCSQAMTIFSRSLWSLRYERIFLRL